MPSTDDLARRLQRLEHVEAITQLKYRYWRACDTKDPKGFRSCFIRSGARIDYGRLGSFDDAEPMARIFEKVALARIDGKFIVYDMHHGMHPDITILDDTSAHGTWSLRFRQVNTVEATETIMTGDYDDEYVVEDGVWKMSVCRFTEHWAIKRSLGDAQIIPGHFSAPPLST
ncbi:nuclear transport factor 2 family protein [Gordonia sp. ABSL49_1]|uniref:nuclear transport factor 2 family protein n=1 Tax=Gordonia sp. ABSL49_1 TaxID=2920941 RepID=UPI001F0E90AC|nr:nuclear transport factor 2 family protein [Gordonia sp. ABSL49_1]MCH5643452.1 nuclear transport factor 2 family protein [Gordonia sp. ABSL49_1]